MRTIQQQRDDGRTVLVSAIMTRNELAEYYKVDPSTVKRWEAQGMPFFSVSAREGAKRPKPRYRLFQVEQWHNHRAIGGAARR